MVMGGREGRKGSSSRGFQPGCGNVPAPPNPAERDPRVGGGQGGGGPVVDEWGRGRRAKSTRRAGPLGGGSPAGEGGGEADRHGCRGAEKQREPGGELIPDGGGRVGEETWKGEPKLDTEAEKMRDRNRERQREREKPQRDRQTHGETEPLTSARQDHSYLSF